jgi:hypothetical protein
MMLEAGDEAFLCKENNRRNNLISAWWFLELPGRGKYSAWQPVLSNQKYVLKIIDISLSQICKSN